MKTQHLLKPASAFIIAMTILFIGGCCSLLPRKKPAPPPEQPQPTVAVPVSGTELDQANLQKVRLGETLKAYPVNRYIDPRDPNLLHEAHLVYRKESSAAWNLTPHAPTVVPLGPVLALSDPAGTPRLLSAEVEQKMAAQNRLMSALIEQNEFLTSELSQLRKDATLQRGQPAPATSTTTTKQP